jgi:hypothetical protein
MFTPPSRAALPIFTDEDSKPHAGATIAVLAAFTQLQHALTQFVAHYSTRRRRSNLDRGRSRRRAILRRNHDPRSVVTLLVATTLVVTVAAGPRLALRSNGSASGPADDSRRLQPRARRPLLHLRLPRQHRQGLRLPPDPVRRHPAQA